MKKILKDISWKPLGEEGSSLAIALFFFLLCSILCAGMLGMGLSQVNSAHTLTSNSDNLDVNSINPAIRTMILKYINQIKDSGIRYYPELNKVDSHLDTPIGLVLEDLCNSVNETGIVASRTLTVVFEDVTSDMSMPTLSDGRYGFEIVMMMSADYDISFCVYTSGNSGLELVRVARIDSSIIESEDEEDDEDEEDLENEESSYISWS